MPHNQSSPAFGYAHNIYSCTKPSEWPILWSEPPSGKKKKNLKKKLHLQHTERRKGRGCGKNDESELKDSFVAQKI